MILPAEFRWAASPRNLISVDLNSPTAAYQNSRPFRLFSYFLKRQEGITVKALRYALLTVFLCLVFCVSSLTVGWLAPDHTSHSDSKPANKPGRFSAPVDGRIHRLPSVQDSDDGELVFAGRAPAGRYAVAPAAHSNLTPFLASILGQPPAGDIQIELVNDGQFKWQVSDAAQRILLTSDSVSVHIANAKDGQKIDITVDGGPILVTITHHKL